MAILLALSTWLEMLIFVRKQQERMFDLLNLLPRLVPEVDVETSRSAVSTLLLDVSFLRTDCTLPFSSLRHVVFPTPPDVLFPLL